MWAPTGNIIHGLYFYTPPKPQYPTMEARNPELRMQNTDAGPAGEALKLARIKDLRWVPRQEYSRLRYMHLKGLANPESWQKAIELHAEMNFKGLELPASEMLEFIEASVCFPAFMMHYFARA